MTPSTRLYGAACRATNSDTTETIILLAEALATAVVVGTWPRDPTKVLEAAFEHAAVTVGHQVAKALEDVRGRG